MFYCDVIGIKFRSFQEMIHSCELCLVMKSDIINQDMLSSTFIDVLFWDVKCQTDASRLPIYTLVNV